MLADWLSEVQFININTNIRLFVIKLDVQWHVLSPWCISSQSHDINLLNRVPEHDCLTFFVLHRTKCKLMHFEWESFSDVTVTLTITLTLFKMHWFAFRSL